jgi:Kef-type K+ transport system membrane component KefB
LRGLAAADAPASTATTTRAPGGHANDHAGGHSDPFAFVLLELAAIILLAMGGRWAAAKVKQTPVLGELLVGVVIGNLGYVLGIPLFILIMHFGDATPIFNEVFRTGHSVSEAAARVLSSEQLKPGGVGELLVGVMTGPDSIQYMLMGLALWLFSNLGVILLLFMVGLESSVADMLKVGGRATAVAVTGVVAPFVCGYGLSLMMLPRDASTAAHLFLAATMCATSVGLTARVFKDLAVLQTREAKVVLGAAVIDDVLGLMILAVAVGVASTGSLDWSKVGKITLLSGAFLTAVIVIGERLAGFGARVVARFDRANYTLLFPLALCFGLSWAASRIELATIVGAFAAGLILRETHFEEIEKKADLEHIVSPLGKIFAPIFFVLMGMQVNLKSFAQPATLGLAAALTGVAIVTKLVCGIVAGPGRNKLAVGIAMVPRGEVGLIFASVGKGLGVVTDAEFSSIVIMVIVTTLVTPPALKWALGRAPATPV